MAQYFTDFGEGYTLGDITTQGWTSRWDTSAAANIIADVDASNGRALALTNNTANSNVLISWDEIDADTGRAELDIVGRIKYSAASGTVHHGFAARASGVSGSPTGYASHILSTAGVQLIRFVNSNSRTDLATNTDVNVEVGVYMHMRMRVSGTNPVLIQSKTWLGAIGDQPEGWAVEYEDFSSSRITEEGWAGLFKRAGADYTWDWVGIGTGGDTAPTESLDQQEPEPEPPEEPGIAFTDGLVSEGGAILFDDGFTGDVAPPDINLLWDFDTANIDESAFSVDWANPTEPVIHMKARLTTYDDVTNSRFIHWLSGISGVQGLRPVFEVDISNRHLFSTYVSSWRPRFSPDITSDSDWVPAPSFTALTGPHRVRFQFAEAFTTDTVYVADQQPYTAAMFAALASNLASDTSGLVSPSAAANASGVIGTSPAEVDERDRQIGAHDIYGFVLGNSSPTLDGGPKRWMIVDCGIHSGEVLDGWPLEGIIDFYLSGVGSDADRLRANWKIGVYFALTPNGRFGGHFRTNFQRGEDPNRDWGGAGAWSLVESVITRDAILSDLDGAQAAVGLSLHTASNQANAEVIYQSTSISDQTVQSAWLDALDTVDGVSWSRINTSIDSSVTGWHVNNGAKVATISEFGTRGTDTIDRYRECGRRYLEATAVVDAQGLFYQPEVEATGSVAPASLAAPAGTASGGAIAEGVIAPVSAQAPTGSAQGGAQAQGAVAGSSLDPVSGTANGGATASGDLAPVTAQAPTGSAQAGGSATATGVIAPVTLSVIEGSAQGSGVATGSLAPVTTTAPTGSATGSESVAGNATGTIAPVTLTAPTGSATASVTATGDIAPAALSAPTGSATAGAVATGIIAPLTLVAPTGSAGELTPAGGMTATIAIYPAMTASIQTGRVA